VQNRLAQVAADKLSETLDTKVRIDKLALQPFNGVTLENVLILDKGNDTLLYAHKIDGSIDLKALFNKTIELETVYWGTGLLDIKRTKAEFNYTFILKVLTSDTTTKNNWGFEIGDGVLKDLVFRYADFQEGISLVADFNKGAVDLHQMHSENGKLLVESLNIQGLRSRLVIFDPIDKDTSIHSGKKQAQNSTPLGFRNVYLSNTSFQYTKQGAAIAEKGIDWNNLTVSKIKGHFSAITIATDLYKGQINHLSLQEKSGFQLSDLTATIAAPLPTLKINVRFLSTPQSMLGKKLAVSFPDIGKLAENPGKISLTANFDSSFIATRDIAFFYPPIDTIPFLEKERTLLEGSLSGTIEDLAGDNLLVRVNENQFLRSSFKLKGLPGLKQLAYGVQLDSFQTKASTINEFFSIPPTVNFSGLGEITIQGHFAGTTDSLNANAGVSTFLGSAKTSLVLKHFSDSIPYVQGNIALKQVALDKLLKNPLLGKVTATARVYTKDKAIIVDTGNIQSIVFKDYKYQDITFSGKYAADTINAKILSKDENLQVLLTAKADLRAKPIYALEGTIEKADLQELNFSQTPLIISAYIKSKFSGTTVDSLRGNLFAENGILQTAKKGFSIDSLEVVSSMEGNKRKITIQSTDFKLNIEGQYSITALPATFQDIAHRYYSKIPKAEQTTAAPVKIQATIEDRAGLVTLFIPGLNTVKNLKISAVYNSDSDSLKMKFSLDQIAYNDVVLNSLKGKIAGDQKKLLAKTTAASASVNANFTLSHPQIEATAQNDTLDFLLALADSASDMQLALNGILTNDHDTLNLTIPKANIILRGNQWKVEGSPVLRYAKNYLGIHNFLLTAKPDQQIVFQTKQEGAKIRLSSEFRNVRLGELANLVGLTYELDGLINGTAQITDPLGNASFATTFRVDSMQADKTALGSLAVRASKAENNPKLQINARLSDTISALEIKGSMNIEEKETALNFTVSADTVSTAKFQPFIKDFVYKLEGKASAQMQITGTLQEPVLEGHITLNGKNTIGLEATKTEYLLKDETVYFSPNQIAFDTLNIFDTKGNRAIVKGNIAHKSLKEFVFDLSLSTSNFLFINSLGKTGLPFYGKIFASANLLVEGPQEAIRVNLNAVTEKNSVIFMDLEMPEANYATPSFIHFTSPDSTRAIASQEEDTTTLQAPSSFAFALSGGVKVTKDARFNLVIDPVNGDKITGQGEGDFTFSFDTENDLNLFGTYMLDEGTYTFTFLDVIKKNFKIIKGSSITWTGDPQAGIMDVTATYTTEASRAPLIADQINNLAGPEARAARRAMPVSVFLFLKGNLASPAITFKIEAPETTSEAGISSLVTNRLEEIENTPSELNKQVFGLIAFNQFMPYDQFAIQGGGGGASLAAQSVSRMLNSQLNRLTEKVGGVDIQLNVKAGDQLNTASVGFMATKAISDRLSVSIGGNTVSSQQYGSGQNYLGDYSVYYRLNDAGTINLKVFSKSQKDAYTDFIQQVSGILLQHSKQFDKPKDIF